MTNRNILYKILYKKTAMSKRSAAPLPAQRQAGFTLVEVLIAVALAGVALTMAAAMFPAAIKENANSYNDSVGVMIARNGLTIARSVLDEGDVTSATLDIIVDEIKCEDTKPNPPDPFDPNDLHYPMGVDETRLQIGDRVKGTIILGRQIGPDATRTHELTSIAYSRDPSQYDLTTDPPTLLLGKRVAAIVFTADIEYDPTDDPDVLRLSDIQIRSNGLFSTVTGNEHKYLKVGAKVFFGEDIGGYGQIIGGTSGSGEWHISPRPLDPKAAQLAGNDNDRVFVTVVEMAWNPSDGSLDADDPTTWVTISSKSPVLAVMSCRTKLKP